MKIFHDFFAANCGKGLQIAARDCKWRQGTAKGGKGVYTHIADFTDPGGLTTPKTDLFVYSGGLCPPIFFLSGFLGGIQKGSETLFPANFYHFDKFNCQNEAIKAVLTPPK